MIDAYYRLPVESGGDDLVERLFAFDKTLEARRYNKRLNDNLAAAVKGKLEQNQIYLRPPLGLAEPTKDFTLIPLEPGKFDIAESFIEKDKQNLYVLARIKRRLHSGLG